MPLFNYSVSVRGGGNKVGRITAKNEREARERLAKEISITEWHSIELEKPVVPVLKKSTPLTKLARMLYLQSGRCFFCGEQLHEKDASIEHLNPKSKGGLSSEDNEVVCHSSLNATFGNMDLKRKFEFTLRSAGAFKCPKA